MKKSAKFNSPTQKQKKYTLEEIISGTILLKCVGNQLYLGAAETPDKPLKVDYIFTGQNTLFRLIPAVDNTVQLYSCFHKNIISGIGKGWPLLPTIRDVSWSIFSVLFDAQRGTIRLKSTHPIAKATPYVVAFGKNNIAQIASNRQDDEFAEFEIFSTHLHAELVSAQNKDSGENTKKSKSDEKSV